MYVDAVTHQDVAQFRDTMSAKRKPRSVNSAIRLLRTLYRDAAYELDLPRDPTLRVKALPELTAAEEPNCLTAGELGAQLAAAQSICPAQHPIFRTLAETGMRVGEVTALRWEDLDEANGQIHIRRAHWRGKLGTTNTNRTRSVPLMDGLADVLKAHRRHLMETQAPGFADGWVFPSKAGTLICGPSLRKPLLAALEEANIRSRFTPHGFRRTFNNLMWQVTTGEVVRSMTGHVTERMTEHYSHVDADEKRATHGRVFAGATGDLTGDQGGSA